MFKSTWKLHLDSSTEDSANKIIKRCIKAFDRPPIESSVTKYPKGGYMAIMEFYHNDNLTWSEVVYEIIAFGQRLGSGWSILGNISEESSAVLSKNAGNHIIIPGLNWAEWLILNE